MVEWQLIFKEHTPIIFNTFVVLIFYLIGLSLLYDFIFHSYTGKILNLVIYEIL